MQSIEQQLVDIDRAMTASSGRWPCGGDHLLTPTPKVYFNLCASSSCTKQLRLSCNNNNSFSSAQLLSTTASINSGHTQFSASRTAS